MVYRAVISWALFQFTVLGYVQVERVLPADLFDHEFVVSESDVWEEEFDEGFVAGQTADVDVGFEHAY